MASCGRSVWLAIAAALSALLAHGAALACGPDSDCVIGERTYRMAVPDGAGPFGAIVYMHGYRGSAAGVMGNRALREVARDANAILIALKSGGPDWLIRNAPRKNFASDERELTYVDAVLEDVAERAPLDRDRLLATDFSAGGMMTWTLACHRSATFAAFLPMAGTFWEAPPPACPGPTPTLVHIHGTGDAVVPLGGRPIANTHQGDVSDALSLFAAARGASGVAEAVAFDGLRLDCVAADAEPTLALCLHDGGHSLRSEWIGWAYATLVASR